ncbi:MAG: hypothetical protein IT246_03820 [Bacteroidia bacterium]|nr:hypothetical protein [Bacteroidia bacterium]
MRKPIHREKKIRNCTRQNHRLEELIYQDVKIYGPTALGDIHKRIGDELSYNKVRKTIYRMIEKEILHPSGNKPHIKYSIVQNG